MMGLLLQAESGGCICWVAQAAFRGCLSAWRSLAHMHALAAAASQLLLLPGSS
jgi:hypothetical protein